MRVGIFGMSPFLIIIVFSDWSGYQKNNDFYCKLHAGLKHGASIYFDEFSKTKIIYKNELIQ